jgi:hypothetical protein
MVATGILCLCISPNKLKSTTVHTDLWWSSYQARTDLKTCEVEYNLACFAVLPNSYGQSSIRHGTVYIVHVTLEAMYYLTRWYKFYHIHMK